MSDETMTADVCVIGAGPAGSAIALRLAGFGHKVVIIERSPFPRPRVGESLTPGIIPFLNLLGVRSQVERAGFLRPRQSAIFWSRRVPRERTWPEEPGFQVERGCFDTILLNAACDAGAHLIQPAKASRPEPVSDGWRVPVNQSSRKFDVRCNYLVDATGKHSTIAGPRQSEGPGNLALFCYWQLQNEISADTRIEAAPDGWYWGAPLPDGSFNAMVVIDRSLPGGKSISKLYHEHISRSVLLSPCLHRAVPGPVRARDATMSWVAEPVTSNLACVGEAALSLDPLSSQGIQTAIRNAVQTSVAINTVLKRPDHTQLAVAFCKQRHSEAIIAHREWTASQYSIQEEFKSRPFWRSRAVGWRREEVAPQVESIPDDHHPIKLAPHVETSWQPCLDAEFVTARRGVRAHQSQRPQAWICDLPIEEVLRTVTPPSSVASIRDRLRVDLNCAPDRANSVIAALWTAGLIERD